MQRGALNRRTGIQTNARFSNGPRLCVAPLRAAPRLGHGSRITRVKTRTANNNAGLLRASVSALLPHHRVEAPRSAAGASEVEKQEAERDGEVAVVEDRKKSARKMFDEIGL